MRKRKNSFRHHQNKFFYSFPVLVVQFATIFIFVFQLSTLFICFLLLFFKLFNFRFFYLFSFAFQFCTFSGGEMRFPYEVVFYNFFQSILKLKFYRHFTCFSLSQLLLKWRVWECVSVKRLSCLHIETTQSKLFLFDPISSPFSIFSPLLACFQFWCQCIIFEAVVRTTNIHFIRFNFVTTLFFLFWMQLPLKEECASKTCVSAYVCWNRKWTNINSIKKFHKRFGS